MYIHNVFLCCYREQQLRELVIDLREPRFKGREEEAELITSSDELLLRTLNEEQRCVIENVSCTYTPSLISLSLSLSLLGSLFKRLFFGSWYAWYWEDDHYRLPCPGSGC